MSKRIAVPCSLEELRKKEHQYNAKYRASHPKTPEELVHAAKAAKERRRKDAAVKGKDIRAHRNLGINWADKDQLREYDRERKRVSRQRTPEEKEKHRIEQKEYNSRPEVKARKREERRAKAEAEGRQYLPMGRSAEQKVADLKERWNDPNLTPNLQNLARLAVRIMLAHEYKKGLCQMRHTSTCTGRIEAHHWKGYQQEMWLDVIWVCKRHHEQVESLGVIECLPYEPDPDYVPEDNTVYANYVSPTIKICVRCNLPKNVQDEYNISRTTSDGRNAACKACLHATYMEEVSEAKKAERRKGLAEDVYQAQLAELRKELSAKGVLTQKGKTLPGNVWGEDEGSKRKCRGCGEWKERTEEFYTLDSEGYFRSKCKACYSNYYKVRNGASSSSNDPSKNYTPEEFSEIRRQAGLKRYATNPNRKDGQRRCTKCLEWKLEDTDHYGWVTRDNQFVASCLVCKSAQDKAYHASKKVPEGVVG